MLYILSSIIIVKYIKSSTQMKFLFLLISNNNNIMKSCPFFAQYPLAYSLQALIVKKKYALKVLVFHSAVNFNRLKIA